MIRLAPIGVIAGATGPKPALPKGKTIAKYQR